MKSQSKEILEVGGFKHRYISVIQLGQTGPLINLPLNEINPEIGEYEVIIDGKPNDNLDGPLIVYKQNGRFTVLTGRMHVAEALNNGETVIQAKLVSKPMLKKARWVPIQHTNTQMVQQDFSRVSPRSDRRPYRRS